MGRHIFELQEKENEEKPMLVHNEQQISEEEQRQIDIHEQEDFDMRQR